MRNLKTCVALAIVGVGAVGCTVDVETAPPPLAVVSSDDGPVIDDSSVVVIQDEPPPDEREYVYDPGFPPGVYLYGDYYWYNGYRYPRQVFIDRYVSANVRDHRYGDPEQNRQAGQQIEAKQRNKYARKHPVKLNQGRTVQPNERTARSDEDRAGKPNEQRAAKAETGRDQKPEAEHVVKPPPPKEANKSNADKGKEKDKDQQ